METRSRMSRSLHTNRDFEKLEPYEGKPSRTVLRGEEGSNALDLPDSRMSGRSMIRIQAIEASPSFGSDIEISVFLIIGDVCP